MIKRTKRTLATVLLVALLAGTLSACGGGGGLSVTVGNSLEYDLTELYISASDADSWGDSLGTLAGGKTMTLKLEPAGAAEYDVMAVDTDGDSYYFYGLPLSNKATLSLASTSTGWEAQITDKKGEIVSVEGELEFGAEDEEIPPPSADDPLKRSVAMPGYENVTIPYPATMQVITEDAASLHLQLDAINDPDVHECITLALMQLGGSYEERLNAGAASAKTALAEITPKAGEILFPGKFIKSVGTNFVDAGNYYSYCFYTWMTGDIFDEAASTPVRGVIDVRYYGPTGYILVILTLADESAIKRYYDVANKIVGDVTINPGWSTAQVVANNNTQYGSDPGDNGLYYDDYYYDDNYYWDDGWYESNDYDDDYYYDDNYYYDDGWYESNDYDPWSDPGDYGYDY